MRSKVALSLSDGAAQPAMAKIKPYYPDYKGIVEEVVDEIVDEQE